MVVPKVKTICEGPWITPQITFAIGVALSVSMALVAFLPLNNPRQAEQA